MLCLPMKYIEVGKELLRNNMTDIVLTEYLEVLKENLIVAKRDGSVNKETRYLYEIETKKSKIY